MPNLDVDCSAKALKFLAERADALVAAGELPEEWKADFVIEMFRSVVRLSESEALMAEQIRLRDEAVQRASGIVGAGGLAPRIVKN